MSCPCSQSLAWGQRFWVKWLLWSQAACWTIASFSSIPPWALLIGTYHLPLGFPDSASGKELTCQCRRHKRRRFNPWVGKIPWRRAWQPTPVFLPGEFHEQMNVVGYCPLGHKELDSWLAITSRRLAETFCKKSVLDCKYSLPPKSHIYWSPPPPRPPLWSSFSELSKILSPGLQSSFCPQ